VLVSIVVCNNISHPVLSSKYVTLTFLPLKGGGSLSRQITKVLWQKGCYMISEALGQLRPIGEGDQELEKR
jgi:hypothetical protein